jgi:phosphoribosylformylglycinamidine synthase subunit PurQ / glutaminase
LTLDQDYRTVTQPRVCVLRAPGTNCDVETAYAFDHCGGASDRVHLFQFLQDPKRLDQYQILCIPGGFSYGDDVGAGVIFAHQMRGRLGDAIRAFLQADKLVLGICNGFQTLLKAGVLPSGAESWDQPREAAEATLTWNHNGRYTARWIHLKTGKTNNIFLKGITEIDLPMAHAEGRLVPKADNVVEKWAGRGQVALTYAAWPQSNNELGATGPDPARWPANPNGAAADIAGLSDPTGRVLGLMPHPERFLFATQHPQWTRLGLSGDGAGMQIFRNAIAYFG